MTIIEKAKSILADMEADPAKYWEQDCYEAYDDMLDECSTCPECGRGGSSLKETDPIAYRCGFADYFDGEVASDFAKQQSEYEELSDAIDAASDAFDTLEEAIETAEGL